MIRAGAAVAVLTLAAVLLGGLWRLGQAREVVLAVGRAVLQLAAVGVVVAAVFRSPALAPVYLSVVLAAAAWTSGRRIGPVPSPRAGAGAPTTPYLLAAASIASGATLAGGIVLLAGALPPDARTAVPFLAQLAGGSMTATTLAGQRLRDDVSSGWAEIEGWLALGATPAQASRDLARRAAARARPGDRPDPQRRTRRAPRRLRRPAPRRSNTPRSGPGTAPRPRRPPRGGDGSGRDSDRVARVPSRRETSGHPVRTATQTPTATRLPLARREEHPTRTDPAVGTVS